MAKSYSAAWQTASAFCAPARDSFASNPRASVLRRSSAAFNPVSASMIHLGPSVAKMGSRGSRFHLCMTGNRPPARSPVMARPAVDSGKAAHHGKIPYLTCFWTKPPFCPSFWLFLYRKSVDSQRKSVDSRRKSVASRRKSVASLRESVASLQESVASLQETIASRGEKTVSKSETVRPRHCPAACRRQDSPIFPSHYSQTRLDGNSDTRSLSTSDVCPLSIAPRFFQVSGLDISAFQRVSFQNFR